MSGDAAPVAGTDVVERPCPDCEGDGIAGGKVCDWCHGTGKWNEEEQNRSRYEVHPVGSAAEITRLRAEVAPVRCPCCGCYRDRGDGTEDHCGVCDDEGEVTPARAAEYQIGIRDTELTALRARVAEAIDALERLAFSWPAPNAHTPQVVQWCIEARAANIPRQGHGEMVPRGTVNLSTPDPRDARIASLEDAVRDACAVTLRHRERAAVLKAALLGITAAVEGDYHGGGRPDCPLCQAVDEARRALGDDRG